MPELPEVETIVRFLKPKLRSKRIISITSNSPRTYRDHKSISEIKNVAEGEIVKNIERSGKEIIFELSNKKCLGIHLMMTGKLLLNPKEKGAHDRMEIKFSGKTKLVFNDIRKFGRCRIIERMEQKISDALSLKWKDFFVRIRSRKKPIKSILLDQAIISGIGNIYSDEILWYAGVDPRRHGNSLSQVEIKRIFSSIAKVLNLAIKKGGTSSRNYRKPDDSEGSYYHIRKVYQRTGEKCKKDKGIIQRVVIGGRSAHFCPRHQE